ncbi:LysR substrate-binding domain-containing protein [Bradyrhizobium sp. BR 1432]|uniref:LysR substrate-binding domain-containing protein n=1 Tax=Bradyrhizobium sp. BR 1432 TaxID=3447966 RepID=UPI003EE57C21
MKISAHQIAAFTEVFRQKSVSEAAAVLGITQSAVTQHLAKLEQRMGTTLFIRYRTGLEPTKPAEELFALTDRVRVLEQLVAEKLDAYSDLSTGHLTVIANAPRPAMPVIAEFNRRFPAVRVEFSLATWRVAQERLAARDVDIAIVTEPEDIASLYHAKLSTTRLMALLRREHPLAERQSLKLAELAQERVVLTENGSLTLREVQRACRDNKISMGNVIGMTTYPVLKEAVLHGIGIGIILNDSMFPADELTYMPIDELSVDFQDLHRHVTGQETTKVCGIIL